MNGHIILHRKLIDWEWWSDINTTRLFLYILLRANWKDSRYKGHDIPRGSFTTSIPKLAKETNLTENEVRTALKHLEKTGEIHRQTNNRFSHIFVQNYDFYQDEAQAKHRQATDKPQSINSLLTANEESKKERRKEYIDSKESIRRKQASDDFERAVDAWNQLADLGVRPVVRISRDSDRGKMLNARIKQNGIDAVLAAIKKVSESDFLLGKVKSIPWFDFEWFVRPNNFPKVLEGKYDNNRSCADNVEDW